MTGAGQFSIVLALTVALAGCAPQESDVKAIVGARLEPGGGKPAIEYSVVVVADGKFRAVGEQAVVPVPKGAAIAPGLGKIVEPAAEGDRIEAGLPAHLVLRNAVTRTVERTMRGGEWMK